MGQRTDRVIGIRAEPGAFHWAVTTGTLERPVLDASDTEAAPKAYGEAESLAWMRQRVLYILDTYTPSTLAVRFPEGNARGANTNSAKARCRVEGVVLEVAGSRNLKTVTGPLSTFSKHLGSKISRDDLESPDFRGIELLKFKSTYLREAILIAASLLPAA
ncbi:MAG: hypothetical protein ABSF15_29575 [Candidatus Sulfotelmatobacter sp.]